MKIKNCTRINKECTDIGVLSYKKDFKYPIISIKDRKELKMALKGVSSINSIVFHISKLANRFNLKENYHKALKSLLLGEKVKVNINLKDARKEYDFIAKIIYDEISGNNGNIRENIKKIEDYLEDYKKTRDIALGGYYINALFHIFLLGILGNNNHISKIKKEDIKSFLNIYSPQKQDLSYIYKILSLFYLKKDLGFDDITNRDVELSMELLYYRIKIAIDDDKIKENRFEYYSRQKELEEKINISTSESPAVQGNLIKLGVILKAVSGDGLYIPEIEKERYISTFAKKYIQVENNKTIRDFSNKVRFEILKHTFYIPIWILAIAFFSVEIILIILPQKFILKIGERYPLISDILPYINNVYFCLIINGVIIALLLFWRQNYINKKHPIN